MLTAPPSPASTTPSISWDTAHSPPVAVALNASTNDQDQARAVKPDRLHALEIIIGKYLAIAPNASTSSSSSSSRRTNGAAGRSRASVSGTGNNGSGNDDEGGSVLASSEQDFADGVMAIRTVAQEKVYMHANPPFATLEAFFLARYCLSRAQVYRHLTCAYVVADLLDAPPELNVHPLPRKQRVAKAVKDLAPNPRARQRLWASTLAHFPRGHEITSSDVCRVAASMGASLTSDETFVLPGVHSQQQQQQQQQTPKVSVSAPKSRPVLDLVRQDRRSLSPLLESSRIDHRRRLSNANLVRGEQAHDAIAMTPTLARVTTISPPAEHSAVMIMDHVITPTSPTFFASNPPRSWSGSEHSRTQPQSRAHSRGHSPRYHPYPLVARGAAMAADAGLLSPPVSPTSTTVLKGPLHHCGTTISVSPRSMLHPASPVAHQYPRPPPDCSFLSSPVMSPNVFAATMATRFPAHKNLFSPQQHQSRSPSVWSPSIAHQRQPHQFAPRRPDPHHHEHMSVTPLSPSASPHTHAARASRSPAHQIPGLKLDPLRLPPLVSPLVQYPPAGLSPRVAKSTDEYHQGHVPIRRGAAYGAHMDWNCALPPMGELLYMADRVAQVPVAADATEVGPGGDAYFRH